MGKRLIGLLLLPENVSLLFLGSEIILAVFQSSRNIDFSKLKLIMKVIGREIESATGLSSFKGAQKVLSPVERR